MSPNVLEMHWPDLVAIGMRVIRQIIRNFPLVMRVLAINRGGLLTSRSEDSTLELLDRNRLELPTNGSRLELQVKLLMNLVNLICLMLK